MRPAKNRASHQATSHPLPRPTPYCAGTRGDSCQVTLLYELTPVLPTPVLPRCFPPASRLPSHRPYTNHFPYQFPKSSVWMILPSSQIICYFLGYSPKHPEHISGQNLGTNFRFHYVLTENLLIIPNDHSHTQY